MKYQILFKLELKILIRALQLLYLCNARYLYRTAARRIASILTTLNTLQSRNAEYKVN
jgi:hypothetical protein